MRFTFPVSICAGLVIEDRFSIVQKLGNGGFGQVYKANDIKYNNEVALKMEPIYKCRTLRNEQRVYDHLWQNGFPIGIPHPISYSENNKLAALAMPIYGMSLREVYKQHGGLSMRSIGHIGVQMLNRLEFTHRNGFVHLDIKPENMMLGRGMDSKTVYLIDFGLAAAYRDKSGKHKPFDVEIEYCGTRVFSSIHRDGLQQYARRDDLESLIYSLVMLYMGRLPWCMGDWKHSKNYVTDIEDSKILYRRSLCDGMPEPIKEAWRIIRNMKFAEEPQYEKLRMLFLEAAADDTEDDGFTFLLE